jgi:mono/diheme cytochrome c family protein
MIGVADHRATSHGATPRCLNGPARRAFALARPADRRATSMSARRRCHPNTISGMHALAMRRRPSPCTRLGCLAAGALVAIVVASALAAEPPELPPAAARGLEVYRSTCMRCHESDPMRDRPGSAARIDGGVQTAIEVIPSMRGLRDRLTAQQVADVQAWLDFVVLLPGAVRPATGWYVDPEAPGRALFHEVGGGQAALVAVHHAPDGRPEWRQLAARYTGARVSVKDTLAQPRNGQDLVGPWQPAQPDPAPLAAAAGYAETDRLALGLPRSQLRYVRHGFAAGATPLPPNPGFPQAGLWWNRDEPGRGFALEVQGDCLLLVAYFFDEAGRATWLATSGAMASANRYAGRWERPIGGPTLEASLRKFAPTNADAGPVAIDFETPRRGTITLPDGRLLPIERLH